MATEFQVRIAGEDRTYAAQTAQAAFAIADGLESTLSRFRANSEISQLARLAPGESLRLTEPVFACLQTARQMESATRRAFCITPGALQTQPALPLWSSQEKEFSVRCESGRLEFDLGAIGKGFALDRMAEVLREWDCPRFLLIAGGSSILAGAAPGDSVGWDCGLGDDHSSKRFLLANISLSGSGLAVKGRHIFDPRTGQPCARYHRAWALATTAAESDALSTASMILTPEEINKVVQPNPDWLVFLQVENYWCQLGRRPLPPAVVPR